MNILENKSTFSVDEMWSITERDGNKKRPYLLLNKLQAKYIPVHPSVTFKMFDELYDQVAGFVNNEMNGKNVIVIGFAETATAIGARIAEDIENNLNAKVTFLPTTREPYDVKPMVEFEEVHSHAVEQILYGNEELFNNADYIVFAEDEVTTGNTILNCVKKMNLNCKFIVASLLNCMDENELNNFKEYNISPVWLTKTDKEGFENLVKHSNINNEYEKIKGTYLMGEKSIGNPRLGIKISEYSKGCELSDVKLNFIQGNCLVLGTEECMYPAIKFASMLEKDGKDVYVSATTRVPSCIGDEEDYPLKNRYEIQSFYGDRKTYVYNVGKYDNVIIVTDGKNINTDLYSVLKSAGNTNILLIRI